MHTHGSSGRRRGKPRSRILYWFRTPPGVRIGRSALDEDAIRLIEEHNPDVEFDWTRILKGQEGADDSRSAQQDRRGLPRPREVPPRASDDRNVSVVPAPTSEVVEGSDAAVPTIDASAPGPDASVEGAEPLEAAVIEEFLAEPRMETAVARPQPGDAISAVEARLGSEGLSRLRARYSEVLARISETVADPTRRDELKTQAERLNPDTWVTDTEVTAALEAYESVFESLRTVVGSRRRRRRRGAGRPRDGFSQKSPQDVSEPEPAGDELDVQEPGEDQ